MPEQRTIAGLSAFRQQSMPNLDIERFVQHLNREALPPFGQGKCAKYVRQALEDAGASTAGHPVLAKAWGATLVKAGFRMVDIDKLENYRPVKGDIAVIQGTSSSSAGHIQGFDGKQWISDFVQTAFWPGPSYRNEKPSVQIYRP